MAWRGRLGSGGAGREPVRREEPVQALAIPLEPGASALIRFGVELAIEAYQRDPQATLARLADAATREKGPRSLRRVLKDHGPWSIRACRPVGSGAAPPGDGRP